MRVLLLVVLLAAPLEAFAEGWPSLATPPSRQGGGENDAALVIGVESYIKLPHVVGAADNARAWYAYLTGTLGVPPAAVQLVLDEDASKESIEAAAERVAKAVKPGGTLWLVFIGHGAPSADGKDGVLVGFDALQTAQSLYARSLGQRQLLSQLEHGAQAKTLLVVDACFSGRSSTGALVPGLQPVVLLRGDLTTSKKPVVALTAGKHDQFAGPLPGGNVPAFSYLALGGLRGWADADGNGVVTAQELVGYSNQMLSTLARDRTQNPEVAPEQAEAVAVARVAKAERGPPLSELVLWLSQGGKGAVGGAPREAPAAAARGPVVKSGAVTAAVGNLTVSARPKDGTRLELTDPQGKTRASGVPFQDANAMVGRWKVMVSADGFEPETREVDVPPDDVTVVKVELKALGALKVSGTPAGASVKVAGPGGFENEGGLPWEASGLKSGEYRVSVSRAGYEAVQQTVTVQPGKAAEVPVKLEKKGALGTASAPSGKCPAGMAFIPGGTYVMGDRKDRVTVASYCLDLTEVTVDAYKACTSSGKCSAPKTDLLCNWGKGDRGRHPVNCVDWNQATAFCAAMGKRLPTEEEWEWVARGGDRGTDYPWGNEAPGRQACYYGEGSELGNGNRQSTCPVGSFTSGDSPQGVHDLAGNVGEWTSSKYDDSPDRVVRGGSCDDIVPPGLLAAFRFRLINTFGHYGVGFRCAGTP